MLKRFSPDYFRGLPREVLVLAAIAFCVALGFGILIPAIPVFARSFDVSALEASAVVSVFALVRFISSPVAGVLVNRAGERAVLASGLLIVAVSSVAAGLSQNFGELLVLRGIGGLGSSMFSVSAMALLLRVVDQDQRGRASSVYQSGFLIGGVTGPALGGLVVGISLRAPFFVYAACLSIASVVALVFLASARLHELEAKVAGPEIDKMEKLKEAMANPAYRAAVLVNLMSGFVTLGLRSSAIPLFVVEGMRRGPSLSGYGFLVAAVVQAIFLLPAGRMTDTTGRRRAMKVGSWALLVGMLMLTVTDFVVNGMGHDAALAVVLFFLALAIQGVAGAYFASAPSAVIGDVIGGQKGGIVVAAYQMASDLGIVIGPLVAGVLIDALDFDWAFAIAALLVVPVLIAVNRMPETLRTRAQTLATA